MVVEEGTSRGGKGVGGSLACGGVDKLAYRPMRFGPFTPPFSPFLWIRQPLEPQFSQHACCWALFGGGPAVVRWQRGIVHTRVGYLRGQRGVVGTIESLFEERDGGIEWERRVERESGSARFK